MRYVLHTVAAQADLSASDPASSVFKQLTFPTAAGEGHPSPVFVPNRFKKDLSTDGVRIGQHYRYNPNPSSSPNPILTLTFTLTRPALPLRRQG